MVQFDSNWRFYHFNIFKNFNFDRYMEYLFTLSCKQEPKSLVKECICSAANTDDWMLMMIIKGLPSPLANFHFSWFRDLIRVRSLRLFMNQNRAQISTKFQFSSFLEYYLIIYIFNPPPQTVLTSFIRAGSKLFCFVSFPIFQNK